MDVVLWMCALVASRTRNKDQREEANTEPSRISHQINMNNYLKKIKRHSSSWESGRTESQLPCHGCRKEVWANRNDNNAPWSPILFTKNTFVPTAISHLSIALTFRPSRWESSTAELHGILVSSSLCNFPRFPPFFLLSFFLWLCFLGKVSFIISIRASVWIIIFFVSVLGAV